MISASANRPERRSLMGRGARRRRRGCRTPAFRAAACLRRACDAGLVGGDADAVAVLRQPRDRLQAAFERPPFGGRLDVLFAVVVDGAVAIEDDELHVASLEMSATWFISESSRFNRACLLARNRASSTFTNTLSK